MPGGGNPYETQAEAISRLRKEEAENKKFNLEEWQETFGALLPNAPVIEKELVLGSDNPQRLFEQDQQDLLLNQGKYFDTSNIIPNDTTSMYYKPPEDTSFDASMGGVDYSEGYWRAFGTLDPISKRNADGYLISNREKDWSLDADYLSQDEYDALQSDLDAGYSILAPNTLDANWNVTGKPIVQFGEGLTSADRNIKVRRGNEELIENLTGTDYKNADTFSNAKELADSAYIQTLRNEQSNYTKGSSEYNNIQTLINKGALDFNKESDYKLITENKFALEAARAQAFVMKDFIHRADPSLRTYNRINPLSPVEEIQGQKTYLTTGTAAHFLDEENDGSEMYEIVKSSDKWVAGDFGQYNTYSYVEPDTEWYQDLAQIAGVIGSVMFPQFSPLISAGSTLIQGGDIGDVVEGILIKKIIPADALENTFAEVGITNATVNDLFGSNIGSTAWSEGLANVTTTGLEGGNLGDAFLSEFGGDLAEPIVGEALDAIPDIDIPDAVTELVQNIETVAQPVINAINTTTEAVENVIDTAIVEPIDKLTQAIIPDDVSLDDAVFPVETVAKPEETPVEPPVEPEETVAETKEEIPVEPEDTTIVEKAASKVGLDAETVSNILDVPTDEVTKVFEDTTDALFAGESGKDALLEGLGGSALEELGEGAENLLGGAVDFIETILPLDPLEDVVGAGVELADAVIGAVGDSELVNAIEEGGKSLGDLGQSAIDAVVDSDIVQAIGEAGQKAIDVGSDVLSEGEDIVRAGGSAVDKAIIQPALGAVEEGVEAVSNVTSEIEDVISDIASEGEDVVRETGRAVDKNVIQPTKEGIDQLVRSIPNPPEIDIELPEFTAPDIDLDIDIDMPEVDIPTPSFDSRLLAGLMATPQQPTQVEGLFDKELFKFDTKIKSTQQMLSPLMNLRRYG